MKKYTISALTSLLLAAATCTSPIWLPVDSFAATLVGDKLRPDGHLYPGDRLYSANSECYLQLQSDCNLHIRRTRDDTAVWSSHTAGFGIPRFALMQWDGNFVIYTSNKGAVWATSRFGSGRDIVMQNDGNLVVYDNNNRPLWESNSRIPFFIPTIQDDADFAAIKAINEYNADKKVTYKRFLHISNGVPRTRTLQVVIGEIAELAEAGEELNAARTAGGGAASGIADGTAFENASMEVAEQTTNDVVSIEDAKAVFNDTADPCGRRLVDGRRVGACLSTPAELAAQKIPTVTFRQVNGQRVPFVDNAPSSATKAWELPPNARFASKRFVYRGDTTRPSEDIFRLGWKSKGEDCLNLHANQLTSLNSGYIATSNNIETALWAGRGEYYTIEIPDGIGLDYNATFDAVKQGSAVEPWEEVGIPKRIPRQWVRSFTNANHKVTNNPFYQSPNPRP